MEYFIARYARKGGKAFRRVEERQISLHDLRRLQAEFENYRKRVARQADEATDRATATLP